MEIYNAGVLIFVVCLHTVFEVFTSVCIEKNIQEYHIYRGGSGILLTYGERIIYAGYKSKELCGKRYLDENIYTYMSMLCILLRCWDVLYIQSLCLDA